MRVPTSLADREGAGLSAFGRDDVQLVDAGLELAEVETEAVAAGGHVQVFFPDGVAVQVGQGGLCSLGGTGGEVGSDGVAGIELAAVGELYREGAGGGVVRVAGGGEGGECDSHEAEEKGDFGKCSFHSVFGWQAYELDFESKDGERCNRVVSLKRKICFVTLIQCFCTHYQVVKISESS